MTDYNSIKYAIYESYKNGEINKNDAKKIIRCCLFIESSMHSIDSIINSITIAESNFMESAVEYSNRYYNKEDFSYEASKFTESIDNAWKNFKKWIKCVKDNLSKLDTTENLVKIDKSKYESMKQCKYILSKVAGIKFTSDSNDKKAIELLDEAKHVSLYPDKSKDKIKVESDDVQKLADDIIGLCDKISNNAKNASHLTKKEIMKRVRIIWGCTSVPLSVAFNTACKTYWELYNFYDDDFNSISSSYWHTHSANSAMRTSSHMNQMMLW